MDKREDDILDDILEEESESSDEMQLPETLMLESTDESTEPEEPEPDDNLSDLSNFLEDDKKEPDEDSKKSAKELDREEIEREIREKIAQERKERLKSIRKISIVCLAVLVVLAAGLFAFFQIAKAGNDYILKFDNKKISVEEFKFFMLLNALTQTAYDKEAAYNSLMDFLILEKAAKDKNVVLTDEDNDYIASIAEDIKNYLESNNIAIPKISDERFEEIIGGSNVSRVIYYKLLDIVAGEAGYTVDENDFSAEFTAYQSEDKLLKYIITNTAEEGETAKEALASGMAADDAIKQYSAYYATYGIETLNASDLGFDEENYNNIMALKALEFSDVIDLGGLYAVFVAVTYEETRDWFRSEYEYNHKNKLFLDEYELWKSEAKESLNEKAFENFDEDEFFNEIFGG